MDRENNSGDGTKDEKLPPTHSNGGPKDPLDPVYPKLCVWQKRILYTTYLVGFALLLYVAYQLCIQYFWKFIPSCRCCTYLALGLLSIVPIIVCYLKHDVWVHEARLEDRSVVDAMIVEAETIEPRLIEPEKKPDNFDQKERDLKNEVARLKDKVGKDGWTEYQVLSLSQMLVEFLKVDDLIATARFSLAELEDYAEDNARPYYWEQYYRWQNKIEEAIKKIEQLNPEDAKDDFKRDQAAEPLRAELRVLLEHVASYDMSWAEGSVIVRGIIICGVLALFPLLGMGLLPLLHPEGVAIFRIFNWGVLGVTGAITAVLLSLRRSDLVEVGNTEGRRELWRTVLGIGLGLVAGFLGYSLIASDIVPTGGAFPKIDSPSLPQIGLSIVWAVASGFWFERIFDYMRGVTVGGS